MFYLFSLNKDILWVCNMIFFLWFHIQGPLFCSLSTVWREWKRKEFRSLSPPFIKPQTQPETVISSPNTVQVFLKVF